MTKASQQSLALDTPGIALHKFVKWTPYAIRRRVLVAGVGRRGGQVGTALGNIALRHAGGYEVVVEFPDGKQESFAPMALFPVTDDDN